MKKIIFIGICVLGLISFSSCRSSKSSCGLADNNTTTTIQTTLKQADII
ncbi:hypothetical protein MC378_04000 [Polaribacter sp. MSW13]|uniref:Uncharacterized protein n=1 Tax=Polaribacter marinus TaxID=2916838 RepID=A0A9X1VKS5_9FLAO|nr:hypothetical protein [Polaribacter marinus]MCI2228319.1 hypothetical protein [Polaribacter marinus]